MNVLQRNPWTMGYGELQTLQKIKKDDSFSKTRNSLSVLIET